MEVVASNNIRLSHKSPHLRLENQTENDTQLSGIYHPPYLTPPIPRGSEN